MADAKVKLPPSEPILTAVYVIGVAAAVLPKSAGSDARNKVAKACFMSGLILFFSTASKREQRKRSDELYFAPDFRKLRREEG